MKGKVFRKVELFNLHGHLRVGNPDYVALFQAVEPDRARFKVRKGERVVLLAETIERNGLYRLKFYEGDPGIDALIADTETADERVIEVGDDEFVAHVTHAVIDPHRRLAAVEYSRRGAKAIDIADVISNAFFESDEFPGLILNLTPVPGEDFLQALNEFTRIKEVTVRLARPNLDWTERMDELSEVAGESGAQEIEATLTAGRGESISKTQGVVQYLKGLGASALSHVKDASVRGRRQGESSDTTVKLSSNTKHQIVDVSTDANKEVLSDEMYNRLGTAMSEIKERDG